MSDLSKLLSVAHLSWGTWAIRSRLIICLVRPERFAHSRSFVLSNLSELLTVAHLIWAKWANEQWANSQPWHLPFSCKDDLNIHLVGWCGLVRCEPDDHPFFQSILTPKSSWWKIFSAARNWINSVPQTAATTFAFSSIHGFTQRECSEKASQEFSLI